ncbi:threonine-phosphate decarboxylase CobD [Vibrio sp. ABG19]|uniref:threonine-phosphate decarboxylase CobD n=1 Tax=Vibrio sp. ABG19 TaxID=2817385 RepID=UPI00249E99EB|nr:threonine-phosphate decarboxylase CobD [Vibrio sp. ABG19]WGY44952.1 threonine-phosphate decarboxylase [Vibrio sp. ABG19]
MAKSGQHGGNVLQMAEQFDLDPTKVIDFSANINPLGIPPQVRDAIVSQLDCLQHYPDIEYLKLHQSLATHHDCPAPWVLPGNGATELIFLWAQYVKPKTALLIEPSFAEYRRALSRVGCAIDNYVLREEDGFAVTERVLDALHGELDCLFICTPNNPTGLMPDRELLSAIVDRCRQLNIRLFVDESFIDFMPNQPSLSQCLADNPHLYVLRSLTKFYALPGLRLGYLLSADQTLLAEIRDEREPWTINALAALAGEILFEDDTYCQATYQWLAQEQKYLQTELARFKPLQLFAPSANYLFFKHLNPTSSLQHDLMRHGILIRSCANYIGLSDAFYRVAIKSHADNQRLIHALQKVLSHG